MKIVSYLTNNYKTITVVSTLLLLPGPFVQDAQQTLLFSLLFCTTLPLVIRFPLCYTIIVRRDKRKTD